jgi:hypothetical protein
MALHRDIFWIGRQWAVTGLGMQAINQKLGGQFDVEIVRLWDEGWLDILRAQSWLNAEDFAKGLAVARARYPAPPNVAPPPLPVEALLRPAAAPESKPIREPVASKVAEPAKPAPDQPVPVVEPLAVAAIEPAKPAPSFLQMSVDAPTARLVKIWRVQRRQ